MLLLRSMAVGGLHPDYSASAEEWARDVLAGEDAEAASVTGLHF